MNNVKRRGARHTALRGASAEGDGGGDCVVNPAILLSGGQEVQNVVPK